MSNMADEGDAPPGPYDHLTDEEKKQLVRGKCNFLALMLLCTIAFVQSGTVAGYCDFAARNVKWQEGFNQEQACASLNFTDSWQQQICNTLFDKHGVGFYAWLGTIPVNQQVCISYDMWVPGRGVVTPTFDAAFNAGKVFAIMANIFGAFAWFTILFSSCCPMHQERLRGLSCYFSLAYICQAFTFLIFASNVCKKGFFYQYFPSLEQSDPVQEITCSLGSGGGLAVSATCIYFVCSLLAPVSLAPLPVGYERMYQQAPQTAAQTA